MKITRCKKIIVAFLLLQTLTTVPFTANLFAQTTTREQPKTQDTTKTTGKETALGQTKTQEQPKTPAQTKTPAQVKVQAAQVNNFVQRFDDKFLINLALERNPGETKKMLFLSNSTVYIAYGVPVALLAGGLIRHDGEMRQNALYIGSSTAVDLAITLLLKTIFKRRRPYVQNLKIIAVYNQTDTSFPSGHTSTSFAMATALSRAYPKWYVILPSYVWAGSVGYSRMYLGVHYPSDVVGGALLGAATAWELKRAF